MSIGMALQVRSGLPAASRRPTTRGPLAAIDVHASQPAELPECCPVVLIPGLLGSKEDFAPVLRRLASRGHRSVAIDLPGQYESPGPERPVDYTIEALAKDVLDVARSLTEEGHGRAHLIGHSFGGLVARAAAIAAPEEISSLVLIGSGPAMIRHARETGIRMLIEAAGSNLSLEMIWDAMAGLRGSEVIDVDETQALRFERERFLRTSRESIVGMGRALLQAPDRTDELAASKVPVFVMYGEDDDGWPPELLREMAGRLGAEHRGVPKAGHVPTRENPTVTAAELLRWLARHERA